MSRPEPDPGAAATTAPSRLRALPGSEAHSPTQAADDAIEVVRRVETDEIAARAARLRFRDDPIRPLDPPPGDLPASLAGDPVYAVRTAAVLNAARTDVPGYSGTLYLTGTRLVLVGQVTVSIPLTDILETDLGGERLLLTLRNGEGATLDVGQPRLFRACLSAVRHLGRS